MFRSSLVRALRAARPLATRPSARAISTLPTLTTRCSGPPHTRAASSTPHGDPQIADGIEVRSLTDNEYHDLADESMDILHENLETLCEDFGPPNWEVEYSSGVMTLILPPHGTYVINKQPPNHQIWVSSPFSGPARFSLSPDGIWVHHRRKGVQLGALLDGELKDLVKGGWEGVGLK
ncbi:hypothetical protein CspHIS471_0202340 [Cutaneotrichosporon sp. HIS471]|nr:hypothetical protein CspHIS471_0202340 [Cutaneotrichosporon sp. HIS471]